MSIIEVINHVGIENVKVQPLTPAIESVDMMKNGITMVRFETKAITPADLLGEMETVGLILWMPKDKLPKL